MRPDIAFCRRCCFAANALMMPPFLMLSLGWLLLMPPCCRCCRVFRACFDDSTLLYAFAPLDAGLICLRHDCCRFDADAPRHIRYSYSYALYAAFLPAMLSLFLMPLTPASFAFHLCHMRALYAALQRCCAKRRTSYCCATTYYSAYAAMLCIDATDSMPCQRAIVTEYAECCAPAKCCAPCAMLCALLIITAAATNAIDSSGAAAARFASMMRFDYDDCRFDAADAAAIRRCLRFFIYVAMLMPLLLRCCHYDIFIIY